MIFFTENIKTASNDAKLSALHMLIEMGTNILDNYDRLHIKDLNDPSADEHFDNLFIGVANDFRVIYGSFKEDIDAEEIEQWHALTNRYFDTFCV